MNRYPAYRPSGVEWLGEVPEHWEIKPLRSKISFRGGTTPSKSRAEFWDGDIPWVSPKDMKRALIADSEDHVTCAALADSACTILPVQSVLVVVRGMILAHSFPAAITAAPVTINQDMKGLITHEPLSHKFLYWFLVGAARALVSLCDESAHGTRKLETATLAGFLTPFPPYGEQAAIVEYLERETERIDALVAKMRLLIARLQEYRTALIIRTVTSGLPSEAARAAGLDPSPRLKPSGVEWLGDVPEHWEVGNIRRYAEMKSGHTPSRQHPEYWEDCDIPWFTLSDVWQLRDGRPTYLGETRELISHVGIANSAAALLPAGSVILSRTASIGFSGIMPVPMATSQDFWNWVCGPKLTPKYLLLTFRSMHSEFNRLMRGSTHRTIYEASAASFCIPVPRTRSSKRSSSSLKSGCHQTMPLSTRPPAPSSGCRSTGPRSSLPLSPARSMCGSRLRPMAP